MENSNTLPVIEIGDTVIFRTDLENGHWYGSIPFFDEVKLEMNRDTMVNDTDTNDNTFTVVGSEYWYSFEMVKEVIKPSTEVIKPTKERVYTEQEMKEGIRQAKSGLIHEIIKMYVPDGNPESFLNKIKSLNK